MSTSETRYTFRARVPVTLHRGRAQETTVAAFRDGAPVVIDAVGSSYTLLAPGGAVVVSSAAITAPDGVATYSLDGINDIGPNAALGQGWQERWVLTMPDGTVRTVRRTAAVALFELHPPVSDDDLLRVYPDLLDNLGNYASNLQGWVDDAWEAVVRTLWKHASFPHIVVEPSDVYAWAREETFARIFRALFKSSNGADERWKELWDSHADAARIEREGTAIVVDRDQDGLQDHDGRERAAAAVAQWNPPVTTNPYHLPRRFR